MDYLVNLDKLGVYHRLKEFVTLCYSKFCFWGEYCFDDQLKQIEDCLMGKALQEFQDFKIKLTQEDPLKIKKKKKTEKKLFEQQKLIKDSVKEVKKEYYNQTRKLSQKELMQQKKKTEERLCLRAEK